MKTSKFTDEQIAMALRQAEAATPVGGICRKLDVSEQTSRLVGPVSKSGRSCHGGGATSAWPPAGGR